MDAPLPVPQEIDIRKLQVRRKEKDSIDNFFGFFSGGKVNLNPIQGLAQLKHAYIKHHT